MSDMYCTWLKALVIAVALAWSAESGAAQASPDSSGVPSAARDTSDAVVRPAAMVPGVATASDREDYLRLLQSVGIVAPYPWSIRGFSPAEVDRLRPRSDSHPRAATPEFRGATSHRYGLALLPVRGDAWLNTGFPYGMNDGVVWRGRGVTAWVSGGVQGRWGPASVTIAPTAYYAQNHPFDLMPVLPGAPAFSDPQYAGGIDLPQRFGYSAYAKVDWGQTAVRVDTRYLTLGVATANQWWGPMTEFPYVLGNNAGGFPHLFAGTGHPVNVFVGSVHGRVIYGEPGNSEYADISPDSRRRFVSGILGVFSPRGVPGLEIGVARFFHVPWPDSGLTAWEFRRPFESLLKASLPVEQRAGDDASTHIENQLASLFFRWVFPGHGIDIYGEFGREDHSWDSRDLLLQLEHSGTYGFGMQKAWRRADRLRAFRFETMNFQVRSIGLHRGEGGIYLHSPLRQGHTHGGQLLGSGFGVGSASGTTAVFEEHRSGGSTSLSWSRLVRMERVHPWMQSARSILPDEVDVQHVLQLEHRRQRKGRQIRVGLGGVYEFNRNLDDDAFNLMLSAGVDLFPRMPQLP